MTDYSIAQIIDEIRVLAGCFDATADPSEIAHYRFRVEPPIPWDKVAIEKQFGIALPPDVQTLWNHTSCLRLFMFGSSPEETGVEFVAPNCLAVQRAATNSLPFSRYLNRDDLIIGIDRVLWDFVIVLRCNPDMSDFGFIFVTQEMDERQEWVYAARSLGEFLRRFLDVVGQEYWHTGNEPHVML